MLNLRISIAVLFVLSMSFFCIAGAQTSSNIDKYKFAINAVSSLDHASNKVEVLNGIARKNDISQGDQMAVVDIVLKQLVHSSNRMDVIKTLLQNEATSTKTKDYISSKMGSLFVHDSDKVTMIKLLTASAK